MGEGIHYKSGHRRRLKERFMKSPTRTLPDYEILEMLLFYIIPLKDTKSIAKSLLLKFGGLIEVLNAPEDSIIEVKGIGNAAVMYFKLLRDLFSRLHLPMNMKKVHILNNWTSVINYCNLTMGFQKTESFRVLYLNSKNMLIAEDLIGSGTVDRVSIHPREIVKSAIKNGALAVILVHNHPSGDISPSREDIALTNKIIEALKAINVVVHDHIIVSNNDHYSFKSNSLI